MTREDWYERFPRVREAGWGIADDGFHEREVTHEAASMLAHVPIDEPWLGAEIGVAQAKSASIMLHRRPLIRLVLVDNWIGWREVREIADHHLSRFDPGRYTIIDRDSTEAAAQFPDKHFDYVFVDASKTPPKYRMDLEAWLPKVRPGGIFAGHDVCRFVKDGVDHVLEDVKVVAAAAGAALNLVPEWYSWWWKVE